MRQHDPRCRRILLPHEPPGELRHVVPLTLAEGVLDVASDLVQVDAGPLDLPRGCHIEALLKDDWEDAVQGRCIPQRPVGHGSVVDDHRPLPEHARTHIRGAALGDDRERNRDDLVCIRIPAQGRLMVVARHCKVFRCRLLDVGAHVVGLLRRDGEEPHSLPRELRLELVVHRQQGARERIPACPELDDGDQPAALLARAHLTVHPLLHPLAHHDLGRRIAGKGWFPMFHG